MTEQAQGGGYLLGQTAAEAERLQDQARRMADETRAVLRRLDLRAGAHCLDVGCGAGDVLPLLAELAGRDGSVTGIDRNDTLGASGLAALRAAWPGQLDFIQDDVLTTTALEPGAFDLTFARLVLLHMPDPKALLARMWAWTRPGGCLLVMDYDFVTQGAAPPLAAMDEYNRLISDLFTATSRDPRIGHKLPAYLADVSGGGPVQTNVDAILLPFAEMAGLLAAGYKSLLPAALEHGVATESRAEQFLADLQAAQVQAAYFLSPLLVSAWKRKPGSLPGACNSSG